METAHRRIKKLRQRGIKFTIDTDEMLIVVCKYEGILNVPTLIRGWVLNRLKTYTRNPRFKRYLKTHPEEAEKIKSFL